jgi:ribosomal subunit interface protein
MTIDRIKATGIELTDAIKDAVEKDLASLESMTARFGDGVSVDVEVGKTTNHHHKGEIFRAEMSLRIPGKMIRVEETAEDLYAAIKEAVRTLGREVVKEKERHD